MQGDVVKIYMVISETPEGDKAIVGTYLKGCDGAEYRVQTFEDIDDAIELMDEMTVMFSKTGMLYYIHETVV